MIETSFLQGWSQRIESLAIFGIIVTALSLMLGIVEREEVPKHIGTTLGIAIVLILIPPMLADAWANRSLSQRIAVP